MNKMAVPALRFWSWVLCAMMLTTCQNKPSSRSGSHAYSPVPAPSGPKTVRQLWQSSRITSSLLPKGQKGRMGWSMKPRYITIHSTQNYSAGARQHARALHNGALRARKRPGGNRTGYLTWHFTVDDSVTMQHLPTIEQGEHADFDGPGNRTSIGIEMCEHRGNDLKATIDRTAMLTAFLMIQHNIPIQNVVPHYHWKREGIPQPHKPCPHFLMDGGHPGKKWRDFVNLVHYYYKNALALRAQEKR